MTLGPNGPLEGICPWGQSQKHIASWSLDAHCSARVACGASILPAWGHHFDYVRDQESDSSSMGDGCKGAEPKVFNPRFNGSLSNLHFTEQYYQGYRLKFTLCQIFWCRFCSQKTCVLRGKVYLRMHIFLKNNIKKCIPLWKIACKSCIYWAKMCTAVTDADNFLQCF